MDRFLRFKVLRALWARARSLFAALTVPHQQQQRLQAQRWQQIQATARHVRDGVVRGSGDPDSALRPQSVLPGSSVQVWQAGQRAAQRQWDDMQRQWDDAQHAAQRQWADIQRQWDDAQRARVEARARWHHQRRGR